MYSYYNNGKFSFPPNFDFNILHGKDSNSTVVSIIGESDLFTCLGKMEIFEKLTETSMKPLNLSPNHSIDNPGEPGSNLLSGYFCESLKIIFIHLRSLNDSDMLIYKCKEIKFEENTFDTDDAFYLKYILYLFLLSDFVVINIVGLNFDTYYVQLLSQANILRKRLKNITENELKTISSSLEVTNHGRLVQPRLLFIFHPVYSSMIEEITKNQKSYESLRDRLEETIFAYLKYHNIIGYEYSIARIEVYNSFVFIKTPSVQIIRSIPDLLSYYIEFDLDLNNIKESPGESESRKFGIFLMDQIETLRIIKDKSTTLSEHISCRGWFKACHKLYNLFSSDKMRFTEILSSHRNNFFKKGCDMSLSLAESHYKDGLPSQYSRDIHSEKTKSARRVMLSFARGPDLLPTVRKLEENLSKVWAVGRQICEAVSVTGQRCRQEVHQLPSLDVEYDHGFNKTEDYRIWDNNANDGDDLLEDPKSIVKSTNLPTMRHSSEVQIVASCNCGQHQAARKDPFDYKESNYVFYEQMNDICCYKEKRVNLPENLRTICVKKTIYNKKFGGPKDSSLDEDDKNLSNQSGDDEADNEEDFDEDEFEDDIYDEDNDDDDEQEDEDGIGHGEETNDDFDLVDLGHKRQRRLNISTSSNEDKIIMIESYCSNAPDNNKLNNKTIIVDKTLFNGMFTNLEDPCSAPLYSSWSLMDCGPYFSYTHSVGLEYPGFVHGSNFLLPWDIPLKTKINKIRKQRVKRAFAAGNFLKAFIGFEMECPVGHRFFLAGPDRMMRGSMASHQVKEAVHGLLTQDVPLYLGCQCGNYLGQLMRIYVAVPPNSGLMKLCIRPRVRPGPPEDTPIFSPGSHSNGVELEAGRLWVLRLPLAYYNYRDGGTIYRNSNPLIASGSKLLKEPVFYEEHVSRSELSNYYNLSDVN